MALHKLSDSRIFSRIAADVTEFVRIAEVVAACAVVGVAQAQ
ncbi:hypothetical protein [Microbacterium testaceum]